MRRAKKSSKEQIKEKSLTQAKKHPLLGAKAMVGVDL
jgi:hypothetical protein